MANNKILKDGTGAEFTTKTTETEGVNVPHVNVDSLPSAINVQTSNISNKFREAFENYVPDEKWTEVLNDGDIIQVDGNTAAASYLVISKSPLNVGETSIETIANWPMPFEASIGLGISQRTVGQEFSVELVSAEDPLPTPDDVQISTIQQSTTTLTVNTVTPHRLRIGMRIGIRDCADSRLNYASLVVATTPSATQFTCTAGPQGNLPSVTAGPFATGFVYFRSAMGLAPNGTSMIFENATATSASFYVRSESGDVLPSGTIAGNQGVTIGTTASVQAVNAAGAYAFQPTNEFRLTQFIDGIQWSDIPVDSIAVSNNRVKRTQVVPDINTNYKLRIRAVNHPSLTKPIAQIVSVAKAGTTTATVTTDVPHGLTTTDLVNILGTRDQTNFANITGAQGVASIINSTQFTIVWGSATTASTTGGIVCRVNGGQGQQGQTTAVAQTVTRTNNMLTLTGNTNWANLLIGDYVEVIGVRDVATNSIGVDGSYRVYNIATSTLILEPIGNAPTGGNIITTNCGGVILKRTDIRLSYLRIMDFGRQRVEVLERPNGDLSKSIPVTVNNTVGVSGAVTANANIGTSGIAAYADSSTNLGAGATFTGTSRDGGSTQGYNKFVAKAFANVAGTLRIEQSANNTTWFRATADTAVAADSVVELSVFATARYHRVVYVNGGVGQTQFLINSAYLRI